MPTTTMVVSKQHKCDKCSGWADTDSQDFDWFLEAQEHLKIITGLLVDAGWDLLGASPTLVELERFSDGGQYDTASMRLFLREEN